MKPFTTTAYDGEFSRSISYSVHGFWPNDSVSLNQYRSIESKEWRMPEVKWAAGGRDLDQEIDSSVAAECFAKAILDAVKKAKKWQGKQTKKAKISYLEATEWVKQQPHFSELTIRDYSKWILETKGDLPSRNSNRGFFNSLIQDGYLKVKTRGKGKRPTIFIRTP